MASGSTGVVHYVAMSDSKSPRSVIGVDVGGTKTLALRVSLEPIDSAGAPSVPSAPDADAEPIATPQTLDRVLLASDAHDESALEQIELAVEALIDRAEADGQSRPEAIGLGLAGFISRKGIAMSAPNTAGLVGVDVPARLRRRFRLPVSVDNDANCVAIAARARLAPHVDTMVAVTLGTGVGGGIIVGGELLRGANGFAGEPGHMVIDPAGPQCPCGQRGCWERYASGNGLGWLAREAASSGKAESLIRSAGSIDEIRGEHVTALLDEGDHDATVIFTEFAGYVALGLANLIMLVDPDMIVIGGGLAAQGERLSQLVSSALRERFPAATRHRELHLVVAPDGPDAGAIGAAILAAASLAAPGRSSH